jgi:hypothetical protein
LTRWYKGREAYKCRVQEVQVQVQRCRGAEVQRRRGAEVQVQSCRCRGTKRR